jgi:copper homeostasis protein
MSRPLLEIAVFDRDSALLAEAAGADRIEFCSDYQSGGVTPKQADIEFLVQRLKIPIHVIVRPRAGNFEYSKQEFEHMCETLVFCQSLGVAGIVAGFLNTDRSVNLDLSREFRDLAFGLSCTFHRAIDVCDDLDAAVKQVLALGYSSILTSGGKATAIEGLEVLKNLQKEFGKEITLIPGGGIRSLQLPLLLKTGCKAFHSAAITKDGQTVDQEEIKKLKEIVVRYE